MSAILHPVLGLPGPSQCSSRGDLSQPVSAVKLASFKQKRPNPPAICARDSGSARLVRRAKWGHSMACACPESFPEPGNVDAPIPGAAPEIKAGPVTEISLEPDHLAEIELREEPGAVGSQELHRTPEFDGTPLRIANAVIPVRNQLGTSPPELQVYLSSMCRDFCYVLLAVLSPSVAHGEA